MCVFTVYIIYNICINPAMYTVYTAGYTLYKAIAHL